jgi:hypothetical protein
MKERTGKPGIRDVTENICCFFEVRLSICFSPVCDFTHIHPERERERERELPFSFFSPL